LPHFLEQELGIAPEQRKAPAISDAEQVKVSGSAGTQKLMEENTDKINPTEYLRRGLSFGNDLDLYNKYEDLTKGYHTDISVADLPEPTTTKQKIAEGIGNVITMTLAQPLIEEAASGLISKIPGGANLLEKVGEASKLRPWTVGYGAEVLKSAATGGLFGLITNNKQSVAQNVLETAGMFAAFSALAYPIQTFFKPILQSVGKMEINNPNLSSTLRDPAVTEEPIAKTLWFKNPKDESQLLKVTANGARFVPNSATELAKAGDNLATLNKLDIEAFKEKPSLYDNLSAWVEGKMPKKGEIPFTIKDNMGVTGEDVFTGGTASEDIMNKTSADLRNELVKTTSPKVVTPETQGKVAEIQSALNAFYNASKQPQITINDQSGSRLANVNTVEYSDGKFAMQIDASTPSHGFVTQFADSKLYNSEEEAIAAGKKELIAWAKDTLKRSGTPEDTEALQNIINPPKKTAATKKAEISSKVADLEKQVADIYRSAGASKDVPDMTKAD
jgi:uncharacterized protein YrrD